MSLYDRLGVARTASAAEIRAAYRRMARAAHPDHAGSAADMAALNEAWRVLGDPGRRAAYDRAQATEATFRWVSDAPASADDDDVDEEVPGERAPGRAGYFVGLPWLLVLTALALIFVFTAYAASGGGDDDDERPDRLLQRGDCVHLRTGHPAEETSCEGSFDAVVADIVTGSTACPAGTEPALGPVGAERLCLRSG